MGNDWRSWVNAFLVGTTVMCCMGSRQTVESSDWTRFRGPNGSGICSDPVAVPTTWSPTENIKWKTALPGAGVSCPIVVGACCFVTCYSGYGIDGDTSDPAGLERHLLCMDRSDGRIRWQRTIAATLPEDPFAGAGVPQHGYASHTPVSDGERVYVFFGKTGALAFDLQGNSLWQTSLGTESDARQWGSASSPVLAGDVLVVAAGAESRAIVGVDKHTGQELWRAEAEGLGSTWGTPIVVRISDDRQDLVIAAPYEIWGLNPATGKLVWYCNALDTDSFSSSVVADQDDPTTIVAAEGRGGGCIALQVGAEGDVSESATLWRGRDSNRFSTPIIYQGRVYFVSSGILTCLDLKTGGRLFQDRLAAGAPSPDTPQDRGPNAAATARDEEDNRGDRNGRRGRFGAMDYASPVIADGKLYYVSRSGNTYVYTATEEPEFLAANRLTQDTEDFSATPAISDGQMFIRSDKYLYCIAKD